MDIYNPFFRMLKNTLSTVVLKSLIAGSLCSCLFLYACFGPSGILKTLKNQEGRFVVIPKGSSLSTIAEILEKENIVPSNISFMASAILSGNKGRLKPGEYAIPLETTPWDLANLIASGKTVIRKFTLIEGGSVNQVITALKEIPVLTGEITHIPQEGFLMPDTYLYSYGDNRQKILDQMENAMTRYLKEIHSVIEQGETIKTKEDLITLASLVEKETALGAERPIVAAVYLNRLKINMPLQCDPTVIYSITKGEKLERPLTKNDLEIQSPYNTYKIKGLPKGAIGCPGKESIQAVLKPAETKALYFVANGKGGHAFAESLDDHNNNVKQWRLHKKNVRALEMYSDAPLSIPIQLENIQVKKNTPLPSNHRVKVLKHTKNTFAKKLKPKKLTHIKLKKKKIR
ncbi:MAG: Endolytic murein transglycosylase [Holosporales bacterium]